MAQRSMLIECTGGACNGFFDCWRATAKHVMASDNPSWSKCAPGVLDGAEHTVSPSMPAVSWRDCRLRVTQTDLLFGYPIILLFGYHIILPRKKCC